MKQILSKEMGAACIVAGTAIGAGMLGLPMVVGGLGITMGIGLLILLWILASFSALLLLEINLKVAPGENFNNMAKKVLGTGGQFVATGSMVFLLYALLVAYLTGTGDLISRMAGGVGMEVTQQSGTVYFAIIGMLIIYLGTNIVVRVNQLLFYAMLVAMGVALFSLTPHVQVGNLFVGGPDSTLIVMSLPVLFTSFGFQTCIPSIVRYLGVGTKRLRPVVLVGSTLPLLCYIFWLIVSLGCTSAADLGSMHGSVKLLVSALAGGSSFLGSVLSAFAALALLTSFLGVALALFDLIAEVFRLGNSHAQRFLNVVIVLGPPLIAGLLAPGKFIQALSHAGAALAILAIFLPCAMAWKIRRNGLRANSYQVCGGTAALVLASVFGVIIVTANYF